MGVLIQGRENQCNKSKVHFSSGFYENMQHNLKHIASQFTSMNKSHEVSSRCNCVVSVVDVLHSHKSLTNSMPFSI